MLMVVLPGLLLRQFSNIAEPPKAALHGGHG